MNNHQDVRHAAGLAFDAAIIPADEAFQDARDAAQRAYMKDTAPAQATLYQAMALAIQTFKDAMTEQAYDAPTAQELKDFRAAAKLAYDRARDIAREAYDKAIAPIEQAFRDAIAPSKRDLEEAIEVAGRVLHRGKDQTLASAIALPIDGEG